MKEIEYHEELNKFTEYCAKNKNGFTESIFWDIKDKNISIDKLRGSAAFGWLLFVLTLLLLILKFIEG